MHQSPSALGGSMIAERQSHPTIVARDLVKVYGQNTVLDLRGTSLAVDGGSIHALVGENGAGKSTLIGILSGITSPTAGTMELDGDPYAPDDPSAGRRRGVAVVLQEPATIASLSVVDNLLIGSSGTLTTPGRRRRAAEKVASTVPFPLPMSVRAGELDAEGRKFIELARALDARPAVLIVDEMTASLSRAGKEAMTTVLREFAADGGSVVYISHYLEEVFEFCDAITVLKDGHIVETGPTSDFDFDRLCSLMVGRALQSEVYGTRVERPVGDETPRLAVRGLMLDRVRDVSFEVLPGRITGFAGIAGCGSIDVARALFGERRILGGSIEIDGVPYHRGRPGTRAAGRSASCRPTASTRACTSTSRSTATSRCRRSSDCSAAGSARRAWSAEQPGGSATTSTSRAAAAPIRCAPSAAGTARRSRSHGGC